MLRAAWAPKASPQTPSMKVRLNNLRIRELQDALKRTNTMNPVIPTPQVAKVAMEPTVRARQAVLTVVTNADWEGAARFTRAVLRKPLQIESTCRVVDDECVKTSAAVGRFDWLGLSKAVQAGILTEAGAVELAASWKEVA